MSSDLAVTDGPKELSESKRGEFQNAIRRRVCDTCPSPFSRLTAALAHGLLLPRCRKGNKNCAPRAQLAALFEGSSLSLCSRGICRPGDSAVAGFSKSRRSVLEPELNCAIIRATSLKRLAFSSRTR